MAWPGHGLAMAYWPLGGSLLAPWWAPLLTLCLSDIVPFTLSAVLQMALRRKAPLEQGAMDARGMSWMAKQAEFVSPQGQATQELPRVTQGLLRVTH